MWIALQTRGPVAGAAAVLLNVATTADRCWLALGSNLN